MEKSKNVHYWLNKLWNCHTIDYNTTTKIKNKQSKNKVLLHATAWINLKSRPKKKKCYNCMISIIWRSKTCNIDRSQSNGFPEEGVVLTRIENLLGCWKCFGSWSEWGLCCCIYVSIFTELYTDNLYTLLCIS